jgi:hypothetical protein
MQNAASNVAQIAVLVLTFRINSIDRLKGMEMSEMQQGSSISNLAGIVVIVVILALSGVIMFQQSQLTKAVTALATLSGKCVK